LAITFLAFTFVAITSLAFTFLAFTFVAITSLAFTFLAFTILAITVVQNGQIVRKGLCGAAVG
jgi:hypothetical protein